MEAQRDEGNCLVTLFCLPRVVLIPGSPKLVNPPCPLPLSGEITEPSQPRWVGPFFGQVEEELLLRTAGLWGLGHHVFHLLQIRKNLGNQWLLLPAPICLNRLWLVVI